MFRANPWWDEENQRLFVTILNYKSVDWQTTFWLNAESFLEVGSKDTSSVSLTTAGHNQQLCVVIFEQGLILGVEWRVLCNLPAAAQKTLVGLIVPPSATSRSGH